MSHIDFVACELMNRDQYRMFYLWKMMLLFMYMHLSAVDGDVINQA